MPLQAEYSRLSHRSEEEVNESFPYLRKSQDWSIYFHLHSTELTHLTTTTTTTTIRTPKRQ